MKISSDQGKRKIRSGAVKLALTAALGLIAVVVTALVTTGEDVSTCTQAQATPGKNAATPIAASSIKLGDFARADSGVKLLIVIFNRLGNEPQLAQKNTIDGRMLASSKNIERDGGSRDLLAVNISGGSSNFQNSRQFGNSISNQNYTDPALAIRPRAVARQSVTNDKLFAIKGITLAMAPAEKKSYMRAESNKSGSNAGSGGAAAESDRKSEEESGIFHKVKEAPVVARSREDVAMKMILGSSVSNTASNAQNVKEFGQNAPAAAPMSSSASNASLSSNASSAPFAGKSLQLAQATGARYSFGGNSYKTERRGINLIDEPLGNDRRQSQMSGGEKSIAQAQLKDEARVAEISNGIIRPTEQPGLYKYIREHGKESAKDMAPPASPAAGNASDAASDIVVAKLRKKEKTSAAVVSDNEITLETQQEGAPLQVAFLPPSTVHGINGLPLGATENETAAFFKAKGNLVRTVISGWKVWTLFDHNQNPLLQVYLRNGRTEAFRIFSQNYVPPGLGVSISDELPSMKGKFGEPAFILEEPGVRAQTRTVMAKNYVYPVSQVSFQLVRTGSGNSPKVNSLLLFRYL